MGKIIINGTEVEIGGPDLTPIMNEISKINARVEELEAIINQLKEAGVRYNSSIIYNS